MTITMEETEAKRPTKDQQIAALQHRLTSLEIELEEMKSNPPLPSKEKLSEAMKANKDLVPEFLKPVVPFSTQGSYLAQLLDSIKEIEKQLEIQKKKIGTLKKGIRLPPIGR